MKKFKWKKSQIVQSSQSKVKALNITQQKPQIFKSFTDISIIDKMTINSIMIKLTAIENKLDKINERLNQIPIAGTNSSFVEEKHRRKKPIQIS